VGTLGPHLPARENGFASNEWRFILGEQEERIQSNVVSHTLHL
jgi:hypothetical protein